MIGKSDEIFFLPEKFDAEDHLQLVFSGPKCSLFELAGNLC